MAVTVTDLVSRCSTCGHTLKRLEDDSGASPKYMLICSSSSCKFIPYKGDDDLACDSAMKLSDQEANKKYIIAKVKPMPAVAPATGQTGNLAPTKVPPANIFNFNNYPPAMKDTCYICGGTTYMGTRKKGSNLQNEYRVWCHNCNHMFYNGNDSKKCMDAFTNSKSGQRGTTYSPPTGRYSAAPKPKPTNDQILKRKCPKCKGKVDLGTNLHGLWVLTCLDCHDVFYRGIDRQKAIDTFDKMTNGKKGTTQVITGFQGNQFIGKNTLVIGPDPLLSQDDDLVLDLSVPPLTMKEAYEANKKSDRCVACSKPTVLNYVLTPAIKYCACIEKLSKEKAN